MEPIRARAQRSAASSPGAGIFRHRYLPNFREYRIRVRKIDRRRFYRSEVLTATLMCSPWAKLRGQRAIPQSLDLVIQQTLRLWRKHHLGYDQTKYVVERFRPAAALEPSHTRKRTVSRLDRSEVERFVQITYRSQSKYGLDDQDLMIKTLFQTGARVSEFVHTGRGPTIGRRSTANSHRFLHASERSPSLPVLPTLASLATSSGSHCRQGTGVSMITTPADADS